MTIMVRFVVMVKLLFFMSLLLLSSHAYAGKYSSGDWIVDIRADYSEAFTANDSGSSIGILCSAATSRCVAYLRSNTLCNESSNQLALINTDQGATSVEMICSKVDFPTGAQFVNLLGDYNSTRDVFLKSNYIGFALPMASGQFKIVRFSLHGSNRAIEEAESFGSSYRGKYRDEMM